MQKTMTHASSVPANAADSDVHSQCDEVSSTVTEYAAGRLLCAYQLPLYLCHSLL